MYLEIRILLMISLDRNVPLDQLKVCDNRTISNKESQNNDIYVIEKILDHRINKQGQLEYHIKWKGWSMKDCTWENQENFIDTAVIDRYFREKSLVTQTKNSSISRLSITSQCSTV